MITTASAPAVIIPPRTSLRTTHQRRRSLPPTADAPLTRRSANHVNVKPASPAVIFSLISTLSAISPPIRNRLEDLPRNSASYSTPSLLQHLDQAECSRMKGPGGNVFQSGPTSPPSMGFDMDYDAHQPPRHLKENAFLCPSDATTAPLPRKSPSWRPSDDILRSRPSHVDPEKGRGIDETSSIGSLSIEPGLMASSASIVSIGSASWKSPRSFTSLNLTSSMEDMRKENANLGVNDSHYENLDGVETGSPNIELDDLRIDGFDSPMIFESTVERVLPPESQSKPPRASSVRITALKGALEVHFDEPSSQNSVRSQRIIPTRNSSLRRSHGGKSSRRKRRSYWSDQSGSEELETLSFDDLPTKPPSQSVFNETAEDNVSRRIRELKDQKKLRDTPLTVTTTDSPKATGNPGLIRILSPLPPDEVLLAEALDDLQPSQVLEPERSVIDEPAELSAPSPAVRQRINRSRIPRMSSTPSIVITSRPFPLVKHNTELKSATTIPPQRSNSRLLRRLSRPSSPANPEKHKRTLSNTLIDERPKSIDSVDSAVDDYIASSRLSQKITHAQTGRIISFSEVGDPDGSVIFCCVGMGLTRYITALYDELALTLKLRLITPDRPGVGGSEVHSDGSDTPLGWPDDVLAICQHLKLTKFSILAHSAGAIYALATALRMPQHIRGRIHLLAPWIPPSQMSAFGTQQEALPVNALPYSQRFLRSLPTPFLRAANSSFLSVTSASITTSLPKSSRRSKRRSLNFDPYSNTTGSKLDPLSTPKLADSGYHEASISKEAALSGTRTNGPSGGGLSLRIAEKERQISYDTRLTEAIWNSATTDANPAVDLLICLERCQPIGFRYVDITRSVVIHHGSKDNRVPVENVKWLGKTMRRCEVRVLEGEGHGLMASAAVMGGVLMEMAKEWEDWIRLVKGKSGAEKRAMR
ncbi:hypothetical protein MMC07_003716 [Pseudocyphellaria aurata]|nr:hypothetical protein [Pseudocyphellaria aurata]